ncbi:hypothetical protein Q9233_014977 [Columba guinea]|nr:hypothetical protein Q9233_014977 [Columba guinea]
MVERTSKFLLIVAVSVCFMLILYQYVGPGLSLGSPSGRSYSEELDLFPTPDPHYVKKYYFPVRELERELAFDMKGEDVIVFLHIQKTGGTTFGRHLVQNVRLEVPCDCRPGQKKCTCYRPNRRETWLFSRFSTGWSCGLHADWTELTNCVPGVLDRRESAAAKTPRSLRKFRCPNEYVRMSQYQGGSVFSMPTISHFYCVKGETIKAEKYASSSLAFNIPPPFLYFFHQEPIRVQTASFASPSVQQPSIGSKLS